MLRAARILVFCGLWENQRCQNAIPLLVSHRVGIGGEADSPHGMSQPGVLETIATATSIAVLGPHSCPGGILYERRVLGQRKRAIMRLIQVVHAGPATDSPLRNMKFTPGVLGKKS